MRLIHFQGLNCFHDCVISIANHWGIHFSTAFASLWSETTFRYDPYREAYLTKRLITNLTALGAKVECADCFSQEDVRSNLSLVQEGAFMIAGMDAFYIPWNQFYQTFHGAHYFIIQNANAETLLCFDPTYNKECMPLALEEFIAHTFDFCRVSESAQRPFQPDIHEEAREILRTHPETRASLLAQIHGCADCQPSQTILLAKYIDAMICNRYLYQYFLNNRIAPFCESYIYLNNDHFIEWAAIKNGLYKASVSKEKERIIQGVCDHLNHLIDEEIAIAEKMLEL